MIFQDDVDPDRANDVDAGLQAPVSRRSIRRERVAKELEGKVAVVTGAASGIGLASAEAMLAAGSRVVMIDRDEAALKARCKKHGDAVTPLVVDLLTDIDVRSSGSLVWK